MKRFPAVLLIGLSWLILASCARLNRPSEYPKAESGVMDLSDWDFSRYGSLELSGEWMFYWENQLTDIPEV